MNLPAPLQALRNAAVCLGAVVAASSSSVWAQAPVHVEQAWARASVAGQTSSGGFLQITAQAPMRLVGASTPAAQHSELHEMHVEDDVMRMRPVDSLELPAGQAVALKPGGHHLMFMQLLEPLQEGNTISVTLKLQDAQGQPHEHTVQMPIQRFTPKDAFHAPKHDAQ